MTLHLGILLALLCAFASNLGFFFKHRGACEAPAIDVRHPLRSAKGLWCSKWFAVGMGVGAGAWALHVAAISLAPLSVVQVVLSGGVVLIAVMADRIFGYDVGKRVVIRWRPGPADSTQMTDVLGILEQADAGSFAVRTRDGKLVVIPAGRALAGKVVPPPPTRRRRPSPGPP